MGSTRSTFPRYTTHERIPLQLSYWITQSLGLLLENHSQRVRGWPATKACGGSWSWTQQHSKHTTTPYHGTDENVDDDEFPIKISLNLHSIFRSFKLPAIKPTEMSIFLICSSILLIQ